MRNNNLPWGDYKLISCTRLYFNESIDIFDAFFNILDLFIYIYPIYIIFIIPNHLF